MTITALVYFYNKPSEIVTRTGKKEYEVKNEVNLWVKTLPGYHSHTFQSVVKDSSVNFIKNMLNIKQA